METRKVKVDQKEEWQQATPDRFWQQIAREQHVLQLYDCSDDLIDTLFHFVDDGFKSNDAVLIISTHEHRERLDEKLRQAGHNIFSLRLRDQYICLDASEMLVEFMIHGMPDSLLFRYTITDLVKRARRSQRRVRAFGEMVAILWDAGNQEAALALEQLWNNYMDMEPFTLFCAYPQNADDGKSMFEEVRHAHKHCLSVHKHNHDQLLFKAS